tara:strand:+ start:565 stop:996 length:432 start_codon:yes stop_codon:yes gene_type:complete
MKYNKKLLLLLFLLNSCVETTAFLGPAVTAGSTGNIYQAGLNYGMNKTVLSTTGKYPIEHLTNILNKTKETVELAKKYKKETVELAKNYKTETVELAKNYKKEHTNNILEKKNNLEAEFIAIVKKNIIDQRYLTEMQQDEKVR